MNTLNNENIIYVPNTLDGENIVSSHLEENALLIDGTNQMIANLNAGNHRVINVSNAISANDAVNKSQLDLKADTSYVDTNFLNKTTTTSQNVASKLTFNNTTTDILNNPVIKFENNINSSSNGMVLHFKKNLINQPNLQIGGLVWLDQGPTSATRRSCEMIVSNDSTSLPQFEMKMSSGVFNPLTIANTQTILRNDDIYIRTKASQNLLHYTTANNYWTMSKNLNMLSNNITNLLDPANLQDAATKFYCDTQSANTNYLLRNGSLAMTGNLNLASHNLITTGTIDCNIIDANGDIITTADMSCADFTSNGNQVIGGSSANVLDIKSSSFFNADALVNNNYHLMLGGNPTTTGGMRLVYDASFQANGTAYLDARATSFKIRLTNTSNPTTDRVEINTSGTTIKNNLTINGDTIIGNNALNDTCTFNCQGTFPDDSKLTFASGSNLEFNLLSFATFNTGSGLIFNDSAINFNEGAVINGSRVNLRSVSGNYTMSNTNQEGGILCTNTSTTISITMPPKNAYWNNRSYYIKTQTGNVNLVQNTGTSIDNGTSTINLTVDYISYLLGFDDDYVNNGKIWKLATHA